MVNRKVLIGLFILFLAVGGYFLMSRMGLIQFSVDGFHQIGTAYPRANVCGALEQGYLGNKIVYCLSGGNMVTVKNIENQLVAVAVYPHSYHEIPYEDCMEMAGTPQPGENICYLDKFPSTDEWQISDETDVILTCGRVIRYYGGSDIADFSPSMKAFLIRIPYTYNWVTANGEWEHADEIYLDQENPICDIVTSKFVLERKDGTCTPSWQCTEWGACISGKETRVCTDVNSCGTLEGKPAEERDCVVPCTPSWTCGEWSACVDELQTRTCTDSNACGTDEGKPSEIQTCEGGIDFGPMLPWIIILVAVIIAISILAVAFKRR